MFCKKCGNELKDNETFCTQCGTQNISAPTPEATAADSPTTLEETTAGSPITQEQASKRKTRTIILISIAAIVLIAAGIFAVIQYKAYEKAHTPINVDVLFSFEGQSSPLGVPVNIQGTNIDGQPVNENFLLLPGGESVEFLQGSYEISIISGAICADGTIYSANEGTTTQSLSLENIDEEAAEDASPIQIVFPCSPVPVAEITDEMLDSIRTTYAELGADEGEVDSAIETAIKLREEERARIAEQERQQQLEKERQDALAANPSVINGTSEMNRSQVAQLTGIVKYEFSSVGDDDFSKGYVCYLQLPSSVTVLGSQYGEPSSRNIILPSSFSNYKGKTITIQAWYSCRATASIPEAPISMIHAVDAKVVRNW